MTNFDKLLASLEPAATAGETEWDNMAGMSMAVSLKRIADVLEGANMDAFQNQLLDIAYKAGLNFRGQA